MPGPRRTVAARPNRRELLVFAEGAVTEETYLKYWHRRFRGQVNVEIHEFHGTPLALVTRAAETKTTNERAERKGRGRAHDEVWCVFDVDEHPHLREAIELAAARGISLAISNPCIEPLVSFALRRAHRTHRPLRRTDPSQGTPQLRQGSRRERTRPARDALLDSQDACCAPRRQTRGGRNPGSRQSQH